MKHVKSGRIQQLAAHTSKGSARLAKCILLLSLLVIPFITPQVIAQSWGNEYIVNNAPGQTEYGRMLRLTDGTWLAVTTFYDGAQPGLDLQIAKSSDNGRTWTNISMISEAGREVDNGQMQLMPDGSILLSCRSVVWGTSFKLPVYKSTDNGTTWHYLSTIDTSEGPAGTMGGVGVYEPHFNILDDGRLAVMYANEKHVRENPSMSQVISEKISSDGGLSWGPEIYVAWEPSVPGARPGMPVWTKMLNGKWIVAYEVCGTNNCNIFIKTSNDGVNWAIGLGQEIPDQSGAPYILSTTSGRLYLSSNNGNVSLSDNYGATWRVNSRPFGAVTWPAFRWTALYETGKLEIAAMASIDRGSNNGSNVKLKFGGIFGGPGSSQIVSGGIYKLVHKGTNQCLDVDANSGESGANVQQWTDNNATAQRWKITLQPDGYYKLNHLGTNQVLDVDAGGTQPGTNVQQWEDLNGDAQRWAIIPTSGGFFKLVNKGTHNCLDVANNDATAGTNVAIWTDNGSDAQQWKLELMEMPIVSGGIYKVTHKGTNQVLDVNQGSTEPGANVAQWFDIGGDAQKWVITAQEGGSFKLNHLNTNQVLDVNQGVAEPGANVQQWTDLGGDAQRWMLDYMGDGYFKIVHRNTNQVLDVDQGSSAPGANVQQWTDLGGDAQRWKLDLVPGSPGTGARLAAKATELATEESHSIEVYPNPFEDKISIKIGKSQEGEQINVQMYNSQGKLISETLSSTNGTKTIDIDSNIQKAGIYFIKVTSATRNETIKVIKK